MWQVPQAPSRCLLTGASVGVKPSGAAARNSGLAFDGDAAGASIRTGRFLDCEAREVERQLRSGSLLCSLPSQEAPRMWFLLTGSGVLCQRVGLWAGSWAAVPKGQKRGEAFPRLRECARTLALANVTRLAWVMLPWQAPSLMCMCVHTPGSQIQAQAWQATSWAVVGAAAWLFARPSLDLTLLWVGPQASWPDPLPDCCLPPAASLQETPPACPAGSAAWPSLPTAGRWRFCTPGTWQPATRRAVLNPAPRSSPAGHGSVLSPKVQADPPGRLWGGEDHPLPPRPDRALPARGTHCRPAPGRVRENSAPEGPSQQPPGAGRSPLSRQLRAGEAPGRDAGTSPQNALPREDKESARQKVGTCTAAQSPGIVPFHKLTACSNIPDPGGAHQNSDGTGGPRGWVGCPWAEDGS